MLGYAQLSSEEKIRRAVRAAKLEIVPMYAAILRTARPEVKLANAYRLFIARSIAVLEQLSIP